MAAHVLATIVERKVYLFPPPPRHLSHRAPERAEDGIREHPLDLDAPVQHIPAFMRVKNRKSHFFESRLNVWLVRQFGFNCARVYLERDTDGLARWDGQIPCLAEVNGEFVVRHLDLLFHLLALLLLFLCLGSSLGLASTFLVPFGGLLPPAGRSLFPAGSQSTKPN